MQFPLKKLTIALLVTMSVQGLALAAAFNDVKSTDPRFQAITDLTQSNVITIDSQGKFNPDKEITRAEFLKVLFDYDGYKIQAPLRNPQIFSDVPTSSPFAPYIAKGQAIHLFSFQGIFQPNSSITRAEALNYALAVDGIATPYSEPKAADLYKDIKTSSNNAYIYAAAKKAGISFSNSSPSFSPTKNLTRGDAAELLYKAKNARTYVPTITATPIITTTPTVTTTVTSGNLPFDTTSASRQKLFNNPKFKDFLNIWDKINDQYIYTNKVTADTLIQGAISGMVGTLDDPYSVYFDNSDTTSFYSTLKGQFEGIGTMIENRDQLYVIAEIVPGSPAEKAGLKPEDVILEVDGTSLANMQSDAVTKLIQGKAGTTVKLKIQRGTNQFLNFSILRAVVTIQNVHSKMLDGNIGYINIDEFSQDSAKLFDKALADVMVNHPTKLIIDLRSNPGGYLDACQKILNHFIPKGQIIFYTKDSSNNLVAYDSEGPAELKGLKIAVLINQDSASASEIFSGAMQDLKLAKIIGTVSYGKGTVQEVNTFGDNSSLKISVGHWETPNQRDINKIGITPDIAVKITSDDQKAGRDPQLDAAIKAVN